MKLEVVLLPFLFAFASTSLDIVVPSYFRTNSSWIAMGNAAAQGISVTAIMNPNSGPGTNYSATYGKLSTAFRAQGGKLLGYIHTSDGGRDLAAMEAEVDAYRSWYTLDGFFLDQYINNANNATLVNTMVLLHNYIKNYSASYVIVANPGTKVNVTVIDAGVADRFVVFEGNLTRHNAYVPDPAYASYSPYTFIHIVYNVPTPCDLSTTLDYVASTGASGVYATEVYPDQYESLTTMWNVETALVQLS